MYVYSIFILNYEVNMNLIYIRYVLKMTVSCLFNGTAHFIPFLFISRSLSVKNPLVFLSTSIRSPCAFPSVSNILLIRSIFCTWRFIIFIAYLSSHARQQFACGRKKDANLTAPICIVLELVSHASLNRTLSFLLLFF